MEPIEVVLSAFPDPPRPDGRDRWRAPCPAHRSTNWSTLSILLGKKRVCFTCHSQNCSEEKIVASLGLKMDDLYPEKRPDRCGRRPLSLAKANKSAPSKSKRIHATDAAAIAAAKWGAEQTAGCKLTLAETSWTY